MPPAGWYPDPSRTAQSRYWSGTEWTDQLWSPPVVRQERAGFWWRVLGYIIDFYLVGIPAAIVSWVLFSAFATHSLEDSLERVLSKSSPSASDLLDALNFAPPWVFFVLGLLTGALWFVYQWISMHAWSATPGMLVCRLSIRIADADLGSAILRRSTVFAVLEGGIIVLYTLGLWGLVLGLLLFATFVWGCLKVVSTPRRQAWHDRLSSTEIIDDRAVVRIAHPREISAGVRVGICIAAGVGLLLPNFIPL